MELPFEIMSLIKSYNKPDIWKTEFNRTIGHINEFKSEFLDDENYVCKPSLYELIFVQSGYDINDYANKHIDFQEFFNDVYGMWERECCEMNTYNFQVR